MPAGHAEALPYLVIGSLRSVFVFCNSSYAQV